MFSSDEDDSQTRFILAILFGLIGIVVAGVIGLGIWKSRPHAPVAAPVAPVAAAAPAPEPAPAPVVAAPIDESKPSVRVENGVVKFYFATAKADVADNAQDALQEVFKGIQGGKTALISGFHDSTGDPARNAALAKKRAESVQYVLVKLGVPQDKIKLVKPAEAQGSGSDAEARRVEVTLID